MTPAYQRCTLRLSPDAAVGDSLRAETTPFDDDWSGAAAQAWRPDPAALEYLHPQAVALVRSLQPAGWQEEDGGDTLVFWLEEARAGEPEMARALAALAALGRLTVTAERPGWDEAWKEFHRPQVVGRLYVRPPWFPQREDLLDVVVDARQAFGTGVHPTTRQCVAALHDIEPGSLLDLGCGTGVVALAASRLGYGPVWGFDIDPVAVAEATENARRNGLSPVFAAGDVTDLGVALPAAETVVANIALRPIERLAPRFAAAGAIERSSRDHGAERQQTRGATRQCRPLNLMLAGLLIEQAEAATAAFPEYEVAGRYEEDFWLALHMRRRA